VRAVVAQPIVAIAPREIIAHLRLMLFEKDRNSNPTNCHRFGPEILRVVCIVPDNA
jgi:hypothetical protein